MAERPKHWIKLWVSWLTSPAHLELSGGALGLGPLLLLLATWDGEYASGGWLLGEDGKPYDRNALARATHRSRGELDRQMLELVRVGTLVIDGRGAYGFAHFGKFQEAKEGKRVRQSIEGRRPPDGKTSYVYFAVVGNARCRIGFSRNPWARAKDMTDDVGVPATLAAKVPATYADLAAVHARFAHLQIAGEPEWFNYSSELRDAVAQLRSTTVVATVASTSETTDDRRQNLPSVDTTPTPPREGTSSGITTETQAEAEHVGGFALTEPKPEPSKRKAPKPKPSDDRIDQVLDAIDRERTRHGLPPLTASQRNATTIAGAFGRGATLERVLAVVHAFGEEVAKGAIGRDVLNATTMFTGPSSGRGGGFAWGESLVDRSLGGARTANTSRPGPAPASPRPTESRTVIVRRGGSDDGQAGAA